MFSDLKNKIKSMFLNKNGANANDYDKEQTTKINDLPIEVLEKIFSYLSATDLVKRIPLVCKDWHQIVSDESFWIKKLKLESRLDDNRFLKLLHANHIYEAKRIYFSRLSGRVNLIKNGSAQDELNHWCAIDYDMNMPFFSSLPKSKKEQKAKDMINEYNNRFQTPNRHLWCVEKHEGTENDIFDEQQRPVKNFANSFQWAFKMQVIDLKLESQLIRKFLDKNINLKLEISENYAARFDCSSVYRLHVLLVDNDFNLVNEFMYGDVMAQWTNAEWMIVKHTFTIDKQFRYVIFIHGGKDTQFWAGFYGSKMTNSIARFSF